MENRDYGVIGRIDYASTKLGSEALGAIPKYGDDIVRALDTICAKLDWANDYILQKDDNTRGPTCDAINDTANGLVAGQTPATPTMTSAARPR